ncbi:sec-independent protein translocase protein TatB [Pseudorhizobium tarimense]|uniref:Sec-independent protein translocase protein TatB n=1 Tax=Pseudorhizobium tarimense TaxID=1079109 RepID=A0ABV2HAB1_9HYPH|nr:Sec-independent protein translocase protein TatB [Pseudorhizobium tarimense]MCJ8520513.1 Sec-independent protein translocase protein TatB [Pseudorhizobium tarimense]
MLDIGWTELLVIGIILIVVVGPKDLPPMLRAFGKMTANLRKIAGEFRSQFDEALRESEMDDVRKTIADVQKLNPSNALRDAINPLRQMGNEIRTDLEKSTRVEKPSEPQKLETAATQAEKPDLEAQKAVEGKVPAVQPAAVSVPQPAMTLPSTPPVLFEAPATPAAAPDTAAKPARSKPAKARAAPADGMAADAAKPKRTRAPAAAKTAAPAEKPAPRKRAANKADTPKDDA